MMRVVKGLKKYASFILTIFLTSILILSIPATAITVKITPSSSQVDISTNNDLSFTLSINLQNPDQYVPIDKIVLKIAGPENKTFEFYPNGTIISGNPQEISIMRKSFFSSYGYGYGYASGYGYLGYGYGYTYTSNSYMAVYQITLKNISTYPTGNYSIAVEVVGRGKVLAKTTGNFVLYAPTPGTSGPMVEIVNQPMGAKIQLKYLIENTPIKINLQKISTMPIKEMEITLKSYMYSALLDIEKIQSLPSSITTPSGKIFDFIEVNTDIPENIIESVKMRFYITKSALAESGINKNSVVLMRFNNGKWTRLNTTIIYENSTVVEYEATSPGLSYYAIVGLSSTTTQPTTGEVSTQPSSETTPVQPGISTQPSEENISNISPPLPSPINKGNVKPSKPNVTSHNKTTAPSVTTPSKKKSEVSKKREERKTLFPTVLYGVAILIAICIVIGAYKYRKREEKEE